MSELIVRTDLSFYDCGLTYFTRILLTCVVVAYFTRTFEIILDANSPRIVVVCGAFDHLDLKN